MEAIKVDIREFQVGLAEYISSSMPVAVTRAGKTVGYFIPTRNPDQADIAALKKAGERLDKLVASKGVEVEALVAEFDAIRKKASSRKKPVR